MRTSSTRRRLVKASAMTLSLGLTCSVMVMGATSAMASSAVAPLPSVHVAPVGLPNGLTPVDEQTVDNMDDLTIADFKPIPNTDWVNPALVPTVKKWKAAVVLVDYPDTPFQVTQPQGSNIWGNPGPAGHDIPRADVPAFYGDVLNKPSAAHNFHTINEYWMEDTAGRYGVELTTFGVYQMPKKSYQYHYSSYGNSGPVATDCPAVLLCNGNFRNDALTLWKAGTGLADPAATFDNVFYLGAGEDQSSSWLEFGQMMFKTPADVTDALGPPAEWKAAVQAITGEPVGNAAPTRYVSWTSWASSASMWPNASGKTSIEAESSGAGVYAHEFSHNLSIGDNYGNPYAANAVRDMSGAWDMMSRGSFNGPGGAHERWHVPSNEGAVIGSQHMLRDKMVLNFVPASSVVNVTRSSLATSGVAVTSVTAREVQLAGQKVGINIVLDGGDKTTCAAQNATGANAWMCDNGNFNNYTLEVVDQMGTDSFQADAGVLLAKTKNTGSPNKWTIDANPQDIDMIDYYQADGTPVKLTRGDHRQLNDALFHAGSDSGSEFEYVDALNNLHFYILNPKRDANGILSYDVAVRNTTGAGTQTRGLTLGAPIVAGKTPGKVVSCTIPLKNTGGTTEDAMFSSDVYRLAATASGSGWTTWLPQQVVATAAGATTNVVVYGIRAGGADNTSTLSLTATSESDSTKTAVKTCDVKTTDTATPGNGVQVISASITGNPLTLNVSANAPVTMNPVSLTGIDQITSGSLNPVQVVDSRGTAAGWDLTGQSSDFVSATGTILAANLGWRPTAMVYVGTLPVPPGQTSVVTPGPTAAPGNGLSSPKTLCKSVAGSSAGSFTCAGGLDLGVPGASRLGAYTGLVTLTLI